MDHRSTDWDLNRTVLGHRNQEIHTTVRQSMEPSLPSDTHSCKARFDRTYSRFGRKVQEELGYTFADTRNCTAGMYTNTLGIAGGSNCSRSNRENYYMNTKHFGMKMDTADSCSKLEMQHTRTWAGNRAARAVPA